MKQALNAGSLYFLGVFAVGFLLGTLRVLVFSGTLDETILVLFELPLMLLVSWILCGKLLSTCKVAAERADRLVMGGLAFGLLMLAEISVSLFGLDRTLSEHLQTLATPGGQIGLFGQLLFGLLPAIQLAFDQK